MKKQTADEALCVIIRDAMREQIAFCANYDVPKVTSLEQALKYLQEQP